MKFDKNVYAEINLDNLEHNFNLVKSINKYKKIIAVVKEDAYGHGAVEISKELIKCGVDMLAVVKVEEAIELRENGINIPILIFGVTPIEYLNELLKYELTQTITSFEYAILLLEELKKINKILKVHIKMETGMGRVGLIASDENLKIVNNIFINPLFNVEGIYSHFSDADNEDESYTLVQYQQFNLFCNNLDKSKLNIKYKHICNSAGSIKFPNFDGNAIRPGIILYGYNLIKDKQYINFKPVMSLKARIVHIKEVHKGESIGYGRTYKADKKRIIATINVGYGSGYPRYLSNKGKVLINGVYCDIVGNICMDHTMIDITFVENVKLFDEVILMGESVDKSIYATDICKFGETICYEVLCGIRRRIPRVYIKDNKVLSVR